MAETPRHSADQRWVPRQSGGRVQPPQAAPLALADELFLVMLDDRSGQLRRHHRSAGIGLAGALLAELVIGGHITVTNAQVHISGSALPVDPLAKRTLGAILANQAATGIRTWLEFGANTAVPSVASRLEAKGWITVVERSRLLRAAEVSYQPIDRNAAAYRAMNLAYLLEAHREVSLHDVTVAGLVAAADFIDTVLADRPTRRQCLAYLSELLQELRDDRPPLHEIFTHVHALVANATLSPH